MNIFVLSRDPVQAAVSQFDTHVIKMVLETAQLLCAPYEPGDAPYRRTHYNHPCGVWTRESSDNYEWLVEHGKALSREYTRRYGKEHKSATVIDWAWLNAGRLRFPTAGLTPFAQAMPPEYKDPDPVLAYRNYYRGAKKHLASWKQPATPPPWWQIEGTDGIRDSQSAGPALSS